MNGGPDEKEIQQEKILTIRQQQTLKDVHRKVKGTYMQLTQLLDDLDMLLRKA